jgi:hypothetical protein
MHEKVFEVFFVEGPNPRRSDDAARDAAVQSVVLERLKQLGYL